MKFIDLCNIRQSNRRFLPEMVEHEKIVRCVEAARIAPSACNSQPWTFVVVHEPELKNRVAKETFGTLAPFNKFTLEAPVMVLLVMEKAKLIAQIGGRIKNKEYPLIDIGIAAEHFCLQAAEEGLGSCMLGWFNEKALKKIVHIPAGKTIGLVIALGYAADEPRKKIRKTQEEIIRFNTYEK